MKQQALEQNIMAAQVIDDKSHSAFYQQAVSKADKEKTWAEFGVYKSASACMLRALQNPSNELHLFDSFEDGLPEPWHKADRHHEKGDLSSSINDVPPCLYYDPKVVIHAGFFDATLPEWKQRPPLGLVHINCDLYSSTKTVLDSIDKQIERGTVLIFDPVFGYPTAAEDEQLALIEWINETDRTLEWFIRMNEHMAACLIC